MGDHFRKASLLLLVVFIASLSHVNGWAEVGHMMVAKIAAIDLVQRGYRSVYESAKKQALLGKELTPNLTDNFESISVWADDTKYEQNIHLYNELHYTSQAYNDDGFNVNFLPPWEDVVSVIETSMHGLKSPKTKGLFTMEKSMLMRFLIHCVGDLHQPLHTTDLVNETYPTGDAGANLFKVKLTIPVRNDTWNITNLHAFWDFAGGRWPILERPISPKSVAYVSTLVDQAMEQHPRTSFYKELQEKNVTKWVRALFPIARDISYKMMIENGGIINEAYDKLTYPVMIRLVALAGYRLSDVLQEIYSEEAKFRERPHTVLASLRKFLRNRTRRIEL